MKKDRDGEKTKIREIRVDYLARVEGEGALFIKLRGGEVESVEFKIFEPPRFFEAFLRGRAYGEAPDITARICGICPVAYQMSAVHAVENAFGTSIPEWIRALRRVIYCGEWIESHALHIHMLHAPDFLGYEDAIQMAKDHPKVIERGLQLKKRGNEIIRIFGGREIHPVNVKVGGFYSLPLRSQVRALVENLKWAREAAEETVLWAGKLPLPGFEMSYEFVSLSHPDEYPMNEGRVVSSHGIDIDVARYDRCFREEQVPYTHALHSMIREGARSYFVGPMARYNLNSGKLTKRTRDLASEAGIQSRCTNPFQSILIRSLEVHHAFDEAIGLLTDYDDSFEPSVPVKPRAGTGFSCTEAPRGLLYHRYQLDEEGRIQDAKIVPPTSQNQRTIEEDLRRLVSVSLSLSTPELTRRCEQAIRNYDPCISCATHFLRLVVKDG